MDESIDVAIIGGGQAGLATSQELTAAGIEHVVLEQGRLGQTWRTRWDSFCLVTPNWSVRRRFRLPVQSTQTSVWFGQDNGPRLGSARTSTSNLTGARPNSSSRVFPSGSASMPSDPINVYTFAQGHEANQTYDRYGFGTIGSIVDGENVIAVEVHQASPSSR